MAGYINYMVMLLGMSGILILVFDVKAYSLAKMKKEEKAARYIGWFNVSLAILAFVGNWVYQQWLW